jgi:uncharacterized protein
MFLVIQLAVTVTFVGIFALIQVPLTVMVGFRRAQTGIQFFDGGDLALLRRMRAHANFTETVPIALLAMAAAELSDVPSWALWSGGVASDRSRDARRELDQQWLGNPRAVGMVLTLLPMAVFGAWALLRTLE